MGSDEELVASVSRRALPVDFAVRDSLTIGASDETIARHQLLQDHNS
jgi:hypothetical protein